MMDLGGSITLVGVLLAGWATGRIRRSMEGAAWGERAATTTATIAVSALAGAWSVELATAAQWWTWQWAKNLQVGLIMTAVTMAAWFALRLWVMPKPYGRANAQRYTRAVFQAVESNDEKRIVNATDKVDMDVGELVGWARRYLRRHRIKLWRERHGIKAKWVGGSDVATIAAEQYSRTVLDLMGDDRWARVIVQNGAKLARDVVRQTVRQDALARISHQGVE